MRKEIYEGVTRNWIRVTKRTAAKAYNAGRYVMLMPVNANPYYLNAPYPVFGVIVDNSDGSGFNRVVNGFEYYNCNSELGRYSKYFIEEEV